jgi:hypothetical protein
MKTNLFWNDEDKTIRGSFINMFLTFSLQALIFAAVIISNEEIIKGIKELQSLIIWFYGISFGLWSGKQAIEFVWGPSGTTTTKITQDQESKKSG